MQTILKIAAGAYTRGFAMHYHQAPLLRRVPPSRLFATVAGKDVCSCRTEIPSAEKIGELYAQRNLGAVAKESKCKELESYTFSRRERCMLSQELNKVAAIMLPTFDDVVYTDTEPFVMLESIKPPPAGDFGDLSGDHGKQAAKFLSYCLAKGHIGSIGSVIDVGGQNTATAELVGEVFSTPNLPAMIVDLSSATPALTPARPHIKYAIGEAYNFFTSPRYEECVGTVVNSNPTLMIFNNMLNVLKAEDAWKMLEAAWQRLRSGDYLLISGLVPEQLSEHGFKKRHEIDGIAEFHNHGKFYKSALLPDFADFIEVRLDSASVLVKQTFEQTIEARKLNFIQVKGYRLLALQKA